MTTAVNRLEGPLPTDNEAIISWVNEAVELFTPDRVVFADGSQEEWDRLAAELVEKGTLIKLNEEKRPELLPGALEPIRCGACGITHLHRNREAG